MNALPLRVSRTPRASLGGTVEAVKDRLRWLRWRLRRPAYPAGGEIRLHLGCGGINHPGFVNVDARPHPHVHHVQGIHRLDAFAEDSVSLIYTCHCLEHVPHRDVVSVLREWRRVLKPGGVLRVSVPDFDLLLDTYLDNGRDMRSVQMPLMGGQDYAFNFHYTCFNATELCRMMEEAGFRSPRRWQHGTDTYTSLPDWSGRNITHAGKSYPVSLNIEAVK